MGGKTATSTSQTTIPPEVLARYNAVNTMAESAANKPYQSFGTQASDYIAQMNQQQNTGINSVNAAAGSYQPYLDAATGATQAGMGSSIDNIQKYMSPYLTNVADTTSALMRQSNEQAQSGALGAAASSGAFGGDRAGIAAANLAGQNQLAMGKTMADIYNQGYGQAASLSQADLARQLQGGAQMAGLGAQAQGLGLQGAQAQLAAGTMQQQTEQAGKDAMIKDFMQRQGYPFQTAQFLANIALGTGVASGTTTTAERPVGFFQNLATGGKANGYADGGGVAGPMQHSQSGVGSQGYVPAGVLPVGDLMISQLPQEEQRSGLEDVMKIASMFMGGKAHGGAAVGRHGYADGGSPEIMLGSRGFEQRSGLAPTERQSVRLPALSNALGLGSVEAFPSPPTERQSVKLPGLTGAATGMEAPPAFPSPPSAGLSPMTSIRPAPRPMGLSGAPTAVDLASAGIGGATPVADTTAYGVDAKSVPMVRPAVSTSPRADTGERLEGGYTPIVPLITQLNFTLHELGKPEYNGYLQGNFRTPSEAAVAFEKIYERAGGAGNKEAASYAEGIHAAAMSGDMSGLPPNVVTSYNHFVENGMDPIQAAGAVGRFMVESYPSLNTNARNTMGGGKGTYGVAQWRGDRMEELANFAGVPLDALTGAPVSTPEGRYYSTGIAGGDGVSGLAGGAGQTQTQPNGLGGTQKAYEDRNALGQFLRTPDGKLNKDAVMSILSGLGTMASSTSMSPLTALLQGAGAGAATYSNLEQARQQKTEGSLQNAQTFMRQYLQAQEMGYSGTPQDYANGIGYTGPIVGGADAAAPTAGAERITSYNEVPLDPFGRGMGMPMTINVNGVPVQIMAGQSYGYLKAMETKLARDVSLGIPGAAETLQQVQNSLANHNGQITLPDGTTTIDPSYESSAFGASATVRDVKRTEDLGLKLPESMRAAQEGSRRTAELTKALTMLPSTGDLSGIFAFIGRAGQQLGLSVPTNAAEGYDIASKIIAEEARNAVSDLAGSVDTSVLNGLVSQSTANPNMAPGAIEELLAIKSGISDYQLALSNALYEAQVADRNVNLAEVERNFVRNNKPEDFVNQRRPEFKGTIQRPAAPKGEITPESAPDGSTSTDAEGKVIIKRNGKWEYQ